MKDIRFFCLTLPSKQPQLGFDYLQAMGEAGLRVLVQSIGTVWFDEEPWCDVSKLFLTSIGTDYVNVVCAPVDHSMGASITAEEVTAPVNLDQYQHPDLLGDPTVKPDEVIYKPPTALGGLFTLGVKNIAITRGLPDAPSEMEIQNLNRYDRVYTLTDTDRVVFTELGISATTLPPESISASDFEL